MSREEGYYWVKWNDGDMMIAEWDGKHWFTIPVGHGLTERQILRECMEIGPRIRTPDEWRKLWKKETANIKKQLIASDTVMAAIHTGRRDIIEELMGND